MRITLEPAPEKGFFKIYAEGELFVTAPESIVSLYSIREHFDFDLSDLSCFAVAVNLYLCKTEAYRLLSRKGLSEEELRKRLQEAGFIHETVVTIIDILKLTGYVNDTLLAQDLAEYRAGQSLAGPRRVQQDLRLRFFSSSDIDAAVEHCFGEGRELSIAEEALNRKYLRLNKPRQRDKIYLFLVRRGFTSDTAGKLAGEFAQEQDGDNGTEYEEQFRDSHGFF